MVADKVKDYLKICLDTFSLLAKINFTIGFILVAIHFYHINYFPGGSDYSIFLDLIFVIAFAGIFSLIIMAASFIFAPYNWINLISMPDIAHYWFKSDAVYVINSYKTGKINFSSKIRKRIGIHYLVYILIYFFILLLASCFNKFTHYSLSVFMITNLILFFISLLFFPVKNGEKQENHQYNVNPTPKQKTLIYLKIISFTATSGLYLLIGISIILLLTTNSSLHSYTHSLIGYAIGVCLIVVTASLICILPPNNNSFPLKIWMLIVGVIFALFSCFLLGLFPNISSLMMSSLKLGNVKNVTLQIDNSACQLVARAGYPIQCNPKIKNYFINNIDLQWRLGEYYITFKSGNQSKEIFIPQTHILGSIISIENAKSKQ
jgi:hypothetical protein